MGFWTFFYAEAADICGPAVENGNKNNIFSLAAEYLQLTFFFLYNFNNNFIYRAQRCWIYETSWVSLNENYTMTFLKSHIV